MRRMSPTAPKMEESVERPSTEAQQSLSAEAYNYLLTRLRSGLIRGGERLVEGDVANQLGFSRVPVRQALLRLVAEGYLVSTPRGYKPPSLELQDIHEVFELRRLLEPRAAAHAARDISAQRIEKLNLAIAEASDAHANNDVNQLFAAALKCRETWLGAVKNSRLAATLTRYEDQILAVRQATLRDPRVQRVFVAGYEELRDAFVRRDSVAAHDAMLRFVLAAERDYSALVEDRDAGRQAA